MYWSITDFSIRLDSKVSYSYSIKKHYWESKLIILWSTNEWSSKYGTPLDFSYIILYSLYKLIRISFTFAIISLTKYPLYIFLNQKCQKLHFYLKSRNDNEYYQVNISNWSLIFVILFIFTVIHFHIKLLL